VVRPPVARQALLDATRAELIENSRVEDLSSIVSRAGVSTGAVYHHFGSKVGLLTAVFSEFFDGSEDAVLTAGAAGGNWIDRERHRTEAMVAYYFGNPLARVILQRNTEHSAIVELETSYLARAEAAVVANLRAGQSAGALPADLDTKLTAAYLVGGLRRALSSQLARTPQPGVADATEELWRFIAATLELPQAERRM
jgi:AcrR family transcriptional regulator